VFSRERLERGWALTLEYIWSGRPSNGMQNYT
jgi:hypothetical protein